MSFEQVLLDNKIRLLISKLGFVYGSCCKSFVVVYNFFATKYITMLYGELVINVWVTLHILATIANLLVGVHVEYKLSVCNCAFSDIHRTTPVASLRICAAVCTQVPACIGFAWKEDSCKLLDTCPRCCNSTFSEDTGWRVFYPDGKNKTNYPISSNSHPSATAINAIHCLK